MNKEHLERLYPDMLPRLYRLANSILRHDADSQDAVQTALLKAWRASDKIKDGEQNAYIARIVINECRNIQRLRMRENTCEIQPAALSEGDFTEDDLLVRQALDALPIKLKLPLMLRYMEGYSEAESARILKISVPALKSRVVKAKKLLKKALNEEVEFYEAD